MSAAEGAPEIEVQPPLTRPWRWTLPAVVLGGFFLAMGATFNLSLQFYWLAEAPYLATALVLGIQLVLTATVLVLRLGRFNRAPLPLSLPTALQLALTAWAGLTLLWSRTEKPFESTGFWVQQLLPILLVLECCAFLPGSSGPDLARRALAAGLAILGVQAIAFHRLQMLSEWDLLMYKNDYAYGAGILILLALDGWARRGWRTGRGELGWIACLLVAALVVAHYTSKTVVGALAAAGALHLLISGGGARRWVAAALISVGMTVVLWDSVAETWDRYNRDAAYASSFSERTIIWEYVKQFIADQPLTGLGFDGFRFSMPGLFDSPVAHAHNDLLMTWVCFGLVGVVLGAAWYGALLVSALGALRGPPVLRRESILPLTLLTFVLVRGLFEADAKFVAMPVALAMSCQVALMRARAAARGLA